MKPLKISVPKQLPKIELPENVQAELSLVAEHYPKIGTRISLLWGSAELHKYLNDLILDNRGDRAGFPPPIAAAIMRLINEHGKLVIDDHKNAWKHTTY
jgi:hypothetical protein